jgi:hypothetical protein
MERRGKPIESVGAGSGEQGQLLSHLHNPRGNSRGPGAFAQTNGAFRQINRALARTNWALTRTNRALVQTNRVFSVQAYLT